MLSQTTGYAVLALGFVAEAQGRPLLVKEISEATGIPRSYLAKIVNQLSRKGLVATQRGIGGGVTLSRPAAKITLYDICSALDDPLLKGGCMLGTAECSDERACPAHSFWSTHRDWQIRFLHENNLAGVAAFESRQRKTRLRETRRTKKAVEEAGRVRFKEASQ